MLCVLDGGDELDEVTNERANTDNNQVELPPDFATSEMADFNEPQDSGDMSGPAAETDHQLDDHVDVNEDGGRGDEDGGHGDMTEEDRAAAAAAGQYQSTQSEAAGNDGDARSPGPGSVCKSFGNVAAWGCQLNMTQVWV